MHDQGQLYAGKIVLGVGNVNGLLHDQHLLHVHEAPGLQPVEVDAAGEVARIQLHLMGAGGDVGVDGGCDELAEGVVNNQCHMRPVRQALADGG